MSKFKFGKKSLSKLKGVNNKLVILATHALATTTVDFSVTDGKRSLERQRKLVADGKSRTLKSNHLIGRAIDVFPVGGTWNKDDPKWFCLVEVFKHSAETLGFEIEFGYDWGWDFPHIELKKGE